MCCITARQGTNIASSLPGFLKTFTPRTSFVTPETLASEKSDVVYHCHECFGYVSHTTCMILEYSREEENPSGFSADDDDEFGDAGEIEHFSHQHSLLVNGHREMVQEPR
ncbi:hypothetical protein ACLB2K_037720 [Fragaria x ananassa]